MDSGRPKRQWSCRLCTFLNPTTSSRCEMCYTAKGAAVTEESSNYHKREGSHQSNDGSEDVDVDPDPVPVRRKQLSLSSSSYSMRSRKPSVISDEEMALQMALDDYDEQEDLRKQGSKSDDRDSTSSPEPNSSTLMKYGNHETPKRSTMKVGTDSLTRLVNSGRVVGGTDNTSRKKRKANYYHNNDRDSESDGGDYSYDSDGSNYDYGLNTGKKLQREISTKTPQNEIMESDKDRGDNDIDKNNENGKNVRTLEERKKRRLEKLLEKTDSMVNKLSSMMEAVKKTATSFHTDNEDTEEKGSSVCKEEKKLHDCHASGIEGTSNSPKIDVPSSSSSKPLPSSVLHQPQFISGGILRDYQLHGVEWLCGIHYAGLNGILADEMGLGKTVQIIAFICALWERYSIAGPHLVVMPLSVLSVWKADVAKFAPGVDLHIHHGNKVERQTEFNQWSKKLTTMRQRLQRANREGGVSKKPEHISVVITTYELAIKDMHILKKQSKGLYKWGYLIVDEAHRIKNNQSKLFECLRSIGARRQLLLTGTPLQNNLTELWSLLNFILPKIFDNMRQFTDWFNRPFEIDVGEGKDKETNITTTKRKYNRSNQSRRRATKDFDEVLSDEERSLIVASLHRVMTPFLLRRVKSDVMTEVPVKVEKMIFCPMSRLQVKLNHELRDYVTAEKQAMRNAKSSRSEVDKLCGYGEMSDIVLGPMNKNKRRTTARRLHLNYNNMVMQLRKICNHPYLMLEDIKPIDDELFFRDLISSSGKFCMLERILSSLIPKGHKIIIFSQMTMTLNLIESLLSLKDIGFTRFDGGTNKENRDTQLALFNASKQNENEMDEYPVLLLSTRAGGVGINLQVADTIILFDSDWNPQMDLQAISRAHRIGQKQVVLILRLVSMGADRSTPSIEERLLNVANQKLVNEKTILADGKFDFGTIQASNNSLNDSIESKKNEGSKTGKSEKTINSILQLFAEHKDERYSLPSGMLGDKLNGKSVEDNENDSYQQNMENLLLNSTYLGRICDRNIDQREIDNGCDRDGEITKTPSMDGNEVYGEELHEEQVVDTFDLKHCAMPISTEAMRTWESWFIESEAENETDGFFAYIPESSPNQSTTCIDKRKIESENLRENEAIEVSVGDTNQYRDSFGMQEMKDKRDKEDAHNQQQAVVSSNITPKHTVTPPLITSATIQSSSMSFLTSVPVKKTINSSQVESSSARSSNHTEKTNSSKPFNTVDSIPIKGNIPSAPTMSSPSSVIKNENQIVHSYPTNLITSSSNINDYHVPPDTRICTMCGNVNAPLIDTDQEVWTYHEITLSGRKRSKMISCDTCHENFHLQCLKMIKSPHDRWNCWNCQLKAQENERSKQRKREVLSNHKLYNSDGNRRRVRSYGNNGICGGNIGDVDNGDGLHFHSIDEFQRKRKGKYVERVDYDVEYDDDDDDEEEEDDDDDDDDDDGTKIEIDGLKFHRI